MPFPPSKSGTKATDPNTDETARQANTLKEQLAGVGSNASAAAPLNPETKPLPTLAEVDAQIVRDRTRRLR